MCEAEIPPRVLFPCVICASSARRLARSCTVLSTHFLGACLGTRGTAVPLQYCATGTATVTAEHALMGPFLERSHGSLPGDGRSIHANNKLLIIQYIIDMDMRYGLVLVRIMSAERGGKWLTLDKEITKI